MSSIGSVLKEARTKKEITLEDVHAKLKIHPRVLQLLEEEKFDKLPSPLFAKSFLKSYAQFLEVNTESLLEDYEKEKKAPEPEQKLYLKPADMSSVRRIPPSWWMGAAAIALLLGVLLPGPSKSLGVKKKAPAIRVEKAVPQEEPQASENWLNSVKLGNFPKIARKQPLDLQIRALEPVWVHVTCDEKVLFQGVIKKGGEEAFKAIDRVEIWTGNASNMALVLNKTSLGSPGKGVVKKMILSHEGVRILS